MVPDLGAPGATKKARLRSSPICTDFTTFITWCYNAVVKRATVTIPDDLAAAVEGYVRAQEAPPPLTAVVQAALRQYLTDRGYLRERGRLRIKPAPRGSGRRDVSQAHDRYLATP